MSVYNRKGGSGKSGTLREQFNYYKRQLSNRLIQEQAFKEARGVGTIEGRIYTMFKNVNYEQVFRQGITRKVKNKTVRFVGNEAVQIQIQSFRERASKSFQADMFITNYLDAMIRNGFDDENVEKVERLLQSCSVDKLSLIVDKGILPSIEFIYADKLTEEEFVEKVEKAVTNGVTREELQEVKEKQRALVRVVKEKSKIMGW